MPTDVVFDNRPHVKFPIECMEPELDSSILYVCRQTRSEGTSVLYASNTFISFQVLGTTIKVLGVTLVPYIRADRLPLLHMTLAPGLIVDRIQNFKLIIHIEGTGSAGWRPEWGVCGLRASSEAMRNLKQLQVVVTYDARAFPAIRGIEEVVVHKFDTELKRLARAFGTPGRQIIWGVTVEEEMKWPRDEHYCRLVSGAVLSKFEHVEGGLMEESG